MSNPFLLVKKPSIPCRETAGPFGGNYATFIHFFAGRAAADAEGATAAEAVVAGAAVSTTAGAVVTTADTTAEGAAASASTVFSEAVQPAKTTQQKITFFMLQSPIIAQLVRGGSNYNTQKNKLQIFIYL